MLLAIDIGNTNTTFGVFENADLAAEFRVGSDRGRSAEEFGVHLRQSLSTHAIDPAKISGVIVSSVVTQLDPLIAKMSEAVFGVAPVFVDHTFDFGLKISYEPPTAIGSDRLVDAFAAVRKYGSPCIVCDFGTATTIDAVNSNNEFLGGIIAPGIGTLAESLFEKTSKLPKVEIFKPGSVIGNSTEGSIRSGIYFGYIGLVDGIIARMIAEMTERPTIVSTGGAAGLIAEGSEFVDLVDRTLMLDGLRMLHERLST